MKKRVLPKVELLCDYINSETVALEREQAVIALQDIHGPAHPHQGLPYGEWKDIRVYEAGQYGASEPVAVLGQMVKILSFRRSISKMRMS